MAKEKKISRKDSKGRVLRKGESERKDGTYMYRYTDERKKRCCVYAKTLPELREKELQIERDKMDNIRVSTKDITLKQLIETYIEFKNDSWAVNSKESYRKVYNKYIKDSWISLYKIKDIKKSDIILYYKDLTKNMSNNSLRRINELFKPAFDLAVTDNMMRYNPTTGVMKYFPKNVKERIPYTIEELISLFQFMKDSNRIIHHQLLPTIIFLSQTMVRGSELAGLTWDDIDFENKIINVDHQLIYQKKDGKFQYFISPPKTKCGIRKIPLTAGAQKALLMQKEIIRNYSIDTKFEIDGYTNFIFVNSKGHPCIVSDLDRKMNRVVERYNAAHKNRPPLQKMTCHLLRHTGCSIYVKIFYIKGYDLKILQKWMGHSSLDITLNLYNHIREKEGLIAHKNISDDVSKMYPISTPL